MKKTLSKARPKPAKLLKLNGNGSNGHGRRAFAASQFSAMTRGFNGEFRTADAALRNDLPFMRARSRELSQNNSYVRGFLQAIYNNVLGPTGINYQSKVKYSKFWGDPEELHGKLDKQANDIIETAWWQAMSRDNYLVSRDMGKREADRMKLRCVIVDGEVYVRTWTPFDNEQQIARQIIEADQCDLNYNEAELPGGGSIRMGIELDKFGARVAYHFLRQTPNDYQIRPYHTLRERVPAEQINHIFLRERPNQTHGIPWIYVALLQLHQLGQFEAAAVLNARIGAARNLFYTKQFPTGWTTADGELSDDARIIDELREGEALELPYGVEPKMLETRYPDGEMEVFNRCIMRGIAVGLGPSYMTMTGDMSQANFSSLRAGKHDENRFYAGTQNLWIEQDCEPEHSKWLAWALARQTVPLPVGKLGKLNAPVFTGTAWESVNPLQDATADALEFNNRTKSISEAIRERGRDPQEVFEEIASDMKLLEELGIPRADMAEIALENASKLAAEPPTQP